MCGRLSVKWQEALEHQFLVRMERGPTAKTTPISSLIGKLWEMRLCLWRSRNEMKHGKTPKEKEKKLKAKLDPKIWRAYAEQYQRTTPTACRQLFNVNMSGRLKFQTKTNVKWLEIVSTAKTAFKRRTEYLLTKITSLSKYYKVTYRRIQIDKKQKVKLGNSVVGKTSKNQ